MRGGMSPSSVSSFHTPAWAFSSSGGAGWASGSTFSWASGGRSSRKRSADRSPASHANFYVGNGVVLLPVFGGASDARATAILRELMPRHEIVGIRCNEVVSGFGAIHCVTQQEPAAVP